MMMIPIHVIAFFLATLLVPVDVSQFTINVQGKVIQWTKQESAWHAVELPRDDWGMYSVADKVVTVTGEKKEMKTDIAKFLTIPSEMDVATVKTILTSKNALGTSIAIKREKNKITLSQTKGTFFKVPATITWVDDYSPLAGDGSNENMHIYLLIGQSNMAGRAPFSEAEAGVMKQTYLLNGEDKWESAKNPLNRYSTIRKQLRMQKMNPGYTFSSTMLEANEDISIGLVVNAKGGTSIKLWAKDSKFYNEAVRRTKIALEAGTLKGILWHQGESDLKDAQYLDKLTALVENLRNDFGMPDLPFVAGQVNDLPLINGQIAKLPQSLAATGFVSSEGLKAMDRWHFDAKSMKLLGQRYAEEMLEIQMAALLSNVDVVKIDAEGNVHLNGKKMSVASLSESFTKNEVIINAGRSTPFSKVTAVMDEAKKAGISKVSFETE